MQGELPSIAYQAKRCCGCSACSAICPRQCITMVPDQRGFLYPVINADECILCRRCEHVCPLFTRLEKTAPMYVFWALSNKDAERKRSSSGGLFAIMARRVLQEGGIVIGAVWDESYAKVRHEVIDRESDLDKVMRSKYVQSQIGEEVFRSIRKALESGRRVLFSGTSCQVAGMNAYLGNLSCSPFYLSIDVICHGVPSPKLWQDWITFLQRDAEGRIAGVNFRDKNTGWSAFSIRYDFIRSRSDDVVSASRVFSEDWYMRAFLQNASLRDSCFTCPSKRKCGSDITLGDFWGVDESHPEIDDDEGVSCVLVNTEKGMRAFEGVEALITQGKSSLQEVLPGNACLDHSVEPYESRRDFMDDVASSMPIPEMMHRWSFKPSFMQRIKAKVRGLFRITAVRE